MTHTAVGLGLVAWASLVLGHAVSAHEAPSGWSYHMKCCHDRDCMVMPYNRVVATDDGWKVEVRPGEHMMWPKDRSDTLQFTVPYTDNRLMESGDTEFHVCLVPSDAGILLRCLYVPPMGG